MLNYCKLLFLFLTISGYTSPGNKPLFTRWVVTNGCSLKVDGSTNINKFSCVIANYSKPDTITVSSSGNRAIHLKGNLKLDVQHFDCHNPVMTADLRKTLKARDFPNLVIRFISMSAYPDANNKHEAVKGVVAIELAGVSKQFEVGYAIISTEKNNMNLVGSRQIKFSDFNIIPPRKLGGMIRTDNELQVTFNIRMKVID